MVIIPYDCSRQTQQPRASQKQGEVREQNSATGGADLFSNLLKAKEGGELPANKQER